MCSAPSTCSTSPPPRAPKGCRIRKSDGGRLAPALPSIPSPRGAHAREAVEPCALSAPTLCSAVLQGRRAEDGGHQFLSPRVKLNAAPPKEPPHETLLRP